MSMHLEGPWLSTTGKKKGKQKFRNAEQARKAREQAEAWQDLLKRHGISETKKRSKRSSKPTETLKSPEPFRRDFDAPKIASLPFTAGPCTKKETQKYTGTLIKGIATMHKSNAVPILNQEDAEAVAKMRR